MAPKSDHYRSMAYNEKSNCEGTSWLTTGYVRSVGDSSQGNATAFPRTNQTYDILFKATHSAVRVLSPGLSRLRKWRSELCCRSSRTPPRSTLAIRTHFEVRLTVLTQPERWWQRWRPGRESYATTDTRNRCLSLVWWRERLEQPQRFATSRNPQSREPRFVIG